jgi:hypothetical protein
MASLHFSPATILYSGKYQITSLRNYTYQVSSRYCTALYGGDGHGHGGAGASPPSLRVHPSELLGYYVRSR